MRWTTLATLAVGLLAAGTSCKKTATTSTTGDIVIGEFASMTGGTASFGQASHRGLVLAIEQASVTAADVTPSSQSVVTRNEVPARELPRFRTADGVSPTLTPTELSSVVTSQGPIGPNVS